MVNLSHEANPDIKAGYWEPPKDAKKAKSVKCASLQECSDKCLEYIDRNGLGGGNWTGGAVFFRKDGSALTGFVQVAKVSYNGRIWDMTGKELH